MKEGPIVGKKSHFAACSVLGVCPGGRVNIWGRLCHAPHAGKGMHRSSRVGYAGGTVGLLCHLPMYPRRNRREYGHLCGRQGTRAPRSRRGHPGRRFAQHSPHSNRRHPAGSICPYSGRATCLWRHPGCGGRADCQQRSSPL
ncbi:hypothetical protein SDC9_156152 [bioreactor metagenome]|uniref:Uncharacterized protein n=1 Tax=bioreactor metagenome TaxID=1076179 RepID=A0A645F5G8_9ZZZZ